MWFRRRAARWPVAALAARKRLHRSLGGRLSVVMESVSVLYAIPVRLRHEGRHGGRCADFSREITETLTRLVGGSGHAGQSH